jgi:magnesium transporter
MIVDRAIYRDGLRTAGPLELGHMGDAFRAGGGLAWVGLYRPSRQEFAAVAAEFGLHERAVEHALHPHQRPRLERYGDSLFCVLRTARYVDETETVEFGEVHVFAGPRFVVTVRHGEATDIAAVRRALESRPDLLRRGPVAILHAIMDRVVDDYAPVVAGVENDVDEIEDEVFDGSAGAAAAGL